MISYLYAKYRQICQLAACLAVRLAIRKSKHYSSYSFFKQAAMGNITSMLSCQASCKIGFQANGKAGQLASGIQNCLAWLAI